MIKLGTKVKDIITGFEGIVTSKVEYLNGCIQYGVKPKMKTKGDGKMPEANYIDEGQLEVIGKRVVVKPSSNKNPGGVMSDMPSAEYSG